MSASSLSVPVLLARASAILLAAALALASPAPALAACAGDCNGDLAVSLGETALGRDLLLGRAAIPACPAFDLDADGEVQVRELVRSIRLLGCPVTLQVTGQVLFDTGGPVSGAGVELSIQTEAEMEALQALRQPAAPWTDEETGKIAPPEPFARIGAASMPVAQQQLMLTDQDGRFTQTFTDVILPVRVVAEVTHEIAGFPVLESARTAEATERTFALDPLFLPNPQASAFSVESGEATSPDGKIVVDGLPDEVTAMYGRAYDPATEPEAFPGDYSEGGKLPLDSSGFYWLEATDANGAPVDELDAAATIRGKIPQTQWGDLEDIFPGTDRIEVPIYTYDQATNVWEQQGIGWLEDDAGTVLPEDVQESILAGEFEGELFSKFETNHFSWMNVDYAYLGPWTLSRLDRTKRNNDCLYKAGRLAEAIFRTTWGAKAFAPVNKPNVDLKTEVPDQGASELKEAELDADTYGMVKAVDFRDLLYVNSKLWDACDQHKEGSLVQLAFTILHETAHWKHAAKKHGRFTAENDAGGEAGFLIERALLGGRVLFPKTGGIPLTTNEVKAVAADGTSTDVTADQLKKILDPQWWSDNAGKMDQAFWDRFWAPPAGAPAMPVQAPDPITLELILAQASYDLGAPIPATVRVTNVSASDVRVFTRNLLEGAPLYFDIRDASDAVVPFRGIKFRPVFDDDDFATVGPGASYDFNLDLTRDPESGVFHYLFPGPGTYTAVARYAGFYGLPDTAAPPVSIVINPGGSLSGFVRDATNTQAISGATVEVYRTGNLIGGTVTDPAGAWSVAQVPPGTVDLLFKANGYLRSRRDGITVVSAQDTRVDVALSPLLAQGELRIVLNWGENPRDLDSHLWLPIETPYHVYYSRDGWLNQCPYAALDVDDTSGFGPETITVTRLFEGGFYRYYVYHYSGSSSIAESQPSVALFDQSGLRATFTPPTTPTTARYWHVFDYDPVTSFVTEVNVLLGGAPDPYPDTGGGCPAERCANGFDDDGDGFVDCADTDCSYDCNEAYECYDGRDNDRDGTVDCADTDCASACSESSGWRCIDGYDNDRDGVRDCFDSDCAESSYCVETGRCSDAYDNDRDRLTDCWDPDCAAETWCVETGGRCSDWSDNDGDGNRDCEDLDCAQEPICAETGRCADWSDNDVDGLTDCIDPDCAADAACMEGTIATCYDQADNDGDTTIDCADAGCNNVCYYCNVAWDADDDDIRDCLDNCPYVANPGQADADTDGAGDPCDNCAHHNPPKPRYHRDGVGNPCDTETCGDYYDNDGDGRTDCFDSACSNDPTCVEAGRCDDWTDNDADGLTDCYDADCFSATRCDESQNCDDDADNDLDGVIDCEDPDCPVIDLDFDGAPDCVDNCAPPVFNPSQSNLDNDTWGDACDNCRAAYQWDQSDGDSDGVGNTCDNCPALANAGQADQDRDGRGDVCDNCPAVYNPDQADSDSDGIGNACEPV